MDNGMEFRLTILGSGSAMPVSPRMSSAHVLNVHGRSFLIDCGEGAQRSMVINHIGFSRLDAIFISHIHGDHLFGLFGLLSTLGMEGRTAPLFLYGPNALGSVVKFFLSFFGEGLPFEIKFTPLVYNSPRNVEEPMLVHSTRKLDVYAFPLDHGLDTFGYLFREKTPPFNVRKEFVERCSLTLTEIGTLKRGEDVIREDGSVIPASEAAYRPYNPRSYAYVSDTAYLPKVARWVKGVDLLYHETTYLADKEDRAAARHHSTTLQAARLALEASPGRLLVGHYSSHCQDVKMYEKECRTIFPETYAVSDGDVYDVPLVRLH